MIDTEINRRLIGSTLFESRILTYSVEHHYRIVYGISDYSQNSRDERIVNLISRANKYIDQTQPWNLAKDNATELDGVLHNLAEVLRMVSILIYPFMHTSSEEIRKQLGIWYADVKWEEAKQIHMLGGEEVKKGKN